MMIGAKLDGSALLSKPNCNFLLSNLHVRLRIDNYEYADDGSAPV